MREGLDLGGQGGIGRKDVQFLYDRSVIVLVGSLMMSPI